MANPFTYVQLQTQDHNRAKSFYSRLFGWRLRDASNGKHKYTEIDVGAGTAGGMMPVVNRTVPSHWLPFVQVANVDKSTEQAKAMGASIIVLPSDVPRKGRYSVINDPTGAALALWTPIRASKRALRKRS